MASFNSHHSKCFKFRFTFHISAINVYVRDIEYLVGFLLNLLFYATPILYTADMFPESIRWVLYLNPMTTIIESYRNIFYYQQSPALTSLMIVLQYPL